MTFLDKIEPHLTSEDLLIQETVLHAINDYPYLPDEWTNQLLQEAFKNNIKLSSILIYIENQNFNEDAIKILVNEIPGMDKSTVHLALNLLERVEPELALANRETLNGYIRETVWDLYELVVHGSREEVLTEYDKTVNALEMAKAYEHDLYVKGKRLAHCIVKKGWITEDEINQVIQEELKEPWFSFLGTLAVYMIGQLKLEKYIPTLSSLLDRDDDVLLDEVAAALIHFQNDDVVKAVKPYLNKDESAIFASSIVENIKSDFAVQALREAYRQAKEIDEQDLLIEALCHQFSEEALPEISKHMENEYTSNLVDIEQIAYGYYSILNLKHPELKLWKQAALEREMEFRKNELLSTAPIRNEEKVGRNDPCPCGSGKKYKKCCLN